jgi:hypothetical protein
MATPEGTSTDETTDSAGDNTSDTASDNTEVDNTDAELPTVEEWHEKYADQDPESGGSADPTKRFREREVSEEEIAEIEAERERRLDPDNRPDNAEVDNTGDNMPDIAKD